MIYAVDGVSRAWKLVVDVDATDDATMPTSSRSSSGATRTSWSSTPVGATEAAGDGAVLQAGRPGELDATLAYDSTGPATR